MRQWWTPLRSPICRMRLLTLGIPSHHQLSFMTGIRQLSPRPNEVEAPDGTSAATYLAALQLR